MRILTITNLYPNRATFNRQQFSALSQIMPARVISTVSWAEELAGGRRCLALLVNQVTTLHEAPPVKRVSVLPVGISRHVPADVPHNLTSGRVSRTPHRNPACAGGGSDQ